MAAEPTVLSSDRVRQRSEINRELQFCVNQKNTLDSGIGSVHKVHKEEGRKGHPRADGVRKKVAKDVWISVSSHLVVVRIRRKCSELHRSNDNCPRKI